MRALHRSRLALLVVAVGAGVLLGMVWPGLAVQMQPLATAFIRLLGWLTWPLIFCMLVSSASTLGRNRELGRVGAAALAYFAVLSILALLFGLAAGWLLQPGATAALAPAMPAPAGTVPVAGNATLGWLERVPPVHANNLWLLLLAVPAGLSMGLMGSAAPGRRGLAWVERGRLACLRAVRMLLLLAPLAAFGAMAGTVGRHGLTSMLPLLKFIVAINLASALFVVVVMGGALRLAGVSLVRFLWFIRAELYLVLFTGSSLAGLAPLSGKLERLGCPRAVTGLVLPFSYSLNLAGTTLYVALGLVFMAQSALSAPGWQQLALMLGVTLVSSKGAVGVPGSGFATLATTVALLHVAPAATVATLFAIDRTMKCRLLTNVIGHGVACLVVAAWDQTLDRAMLAAALSDT